MRSLMLLCFGIGAIWDGITTMLGIATVLAAKSELDYALCFVGGLLILGFSLGTTTIFNERGVAYMLMRVLWGMAILFDVYTAFMGNAQYIVVKSSGGSPLLQGLEFRQIVVLMVMTILVSSSPVFISYLMEKQKN